MNADDHLNSQVGFFLGLDPVLEKEKLWMIRAVDRNRVLKRTQDWHGQMESGAGLEVG